jgi:hypothetical protein
VVGDSSGDVCTLSGVVEVIEVAVASVAFESVFCPE